ncbi:AraC family transcriptional regulator [Hyunsoonleella pacifica]|uniref:AraC family transcriptional regulator n=1 Tax=Hyunsoonleella pacifica TaxID=1080224 RepID=A0A4Q9FTF0_9FLAO|nr:AraC family transcriptional regulator [Hyunsoonleella pacifica]TBN18960.1 AraC family transcriptional regulator [Hyunsoonleella pacifica]GGD06159.1 AraC family transcriptional regulator [Hyunsoonleella pacifica]
MKASFYKILFDEETPFRCTYLDKPSFDMPWHFHPELELTLILESEGVRYIGDHTSRYKAGDLVLVGSNLPHMWVNNNTETPNANKALSRSIRITLQFPPDMIDNMFKKAQELQPLIQLFTLAQRGISFSQTTSEEIKPLFLEINDRTGLRKWISVFDLLFKLTEAEGYKLLASPGYLPQLTRKDHGLVNKVFNHIETHFKDKITLQEMADMACLTKPSFCRLFKQKTGKTFFDFLNEYRINHAKRLLLDNTNESINTVAIHSGFPTIQHFNKKFKELNKGLTPSQFLKANAR